MTNVPARADASPPSRSARTSVRRSTGSAPTSSPCSPLDGAFEQRRRRRRLPRTASRSSIIADDEHLRRSRRRRRQRARWRPPRAVAKGSAERRIVAVTDVAGAGRHLRAPAIRSGSTSSTRRWRMDGTINKIDGAGASRSDGPSSLAASPRRGRTVRRVRMITYYVDTTHQPGQPAPDAADQRRSARRTPSAFELEAFRLTYDLADGIDQPGRRADGRGRSGRRRRLRAVGLLAEPDPQGQRDAGRSGRSSAAKRSGFYHNTLFTQVALRSLAFVDRYN